MVTRLGKSERPDPLERAAAGGTVGEFAGEETGGIESGQQEKFLLSEADLDQLPPRQQFGRALTVEDGHQPLTAGVAFVIPHTAEQAYLFLGKPSGNNPGFVDGGV